MDRLEQTLATVHALLKANGHKEAADLVRDNPAREELVGHDNWDGGTDIYEVQFQIPPDTFARFGGRREDLEKQISDCLKTVLESETTGAWYSARIYPLKQLQAEWRNPAGSVPPQVRRNIFDGLRLEGAAWNGSLDDVEFLSRIYDLEKLPSNDARFKTAAVDIWQHTVNNANDWDRDWIYTDARFKLTDGPTNLFLSFLCELLHPVVRPSREEVEKLATQFNDQLHTVGWEVYEIERIAGRPRFAYRPVSQVKSMAVRRSKAVADALDAGWMANEIRRMEAAIDDDPALAIGTAKELVETCCKSILTRLDVAFGRSDDIGDLTKKLTSALKLVPEGISDETKGADNIRAILRNLSQIAHNLAQLRGLYGTGHGRDGKHRGLSPRHARLAVAAAAAFVDFVTETYRLRAASSGGEPNEPGPASRVQSTE